MIACNYFVFFNLCEPFDRPFLLANAFENKLRSFKQFKQFRPFEGTQKVANPDHFRRGSFGRSPAQLLYNEVEPAKIGERLAFWGEESLFGLNYIFL